MTARLTFFLGRAGTGKTHACLEGIRTALRTEPPNGPPLLLLTPEQATFQMERALLAHPDVRATSRAQVVSFQRLAARVMQQTGGGAHPRLGDLGKRMLLRALIQRHGQRLQLFGRAARRTGFVDRLAGTLSELRRYNVSPEHLAARLAGGVEDDPVLAAKMHDLHLIYKDFVAEVEGRFTDPDDVLNGVATAVREANLFRGARIWVDGFAGFTPQEFLVLRALWSQGTEMNVSLCLDPRLVVQSGPGGDAPGSSSGAPGPTDMFLPTLETYDQLLEFAREDGVSVQPPVVFDPAPPPRFAHPVLTHLEDQLFQRPGRPYCPDPSPSARDEDEEALRLVAAAGPRVEVEAAAKHILRLARERGWRFRDMAVIVHDLSAYEDVIKAVFTDYRIPYFIDSRRQLAHHPLTELVRSMLESYATGWATEAVVRCLKTDFFPVTRDEVDRLENYALAHGIRGRGWIDETPWRFVRHFTLAPDAPRPTARQQAELEQVNDIRDRALGPLRRLAQAFGRSRRGKDYAAALWDVLAQLDVADTLERWIDEAEGAGRVDEAQEHERAWHGVVQVLDELVHALGDVPMGAVEFRHIVEAGLESLTVGMVPAGLDQVMVGTVERSRQPDIKAAFVLGAADRQFPPPPAEDVMFNDAEREQLARRRLLLSPTSREESLRQQYFLYILLTRASHFLWVSYPATNGQGKEQAPAATWHRLRELFPTVPVASEMVEPEEDDLLLARIATVDDLIGTTARRLRRHRAGQPASALWWRLYDRIAREDPLRPRAASLFAALDYSNRVPPLPDDVAIGLFGDPLHSSVSRLETFAACPFRHFAQYGLGLRERETWQLDAAAAGTFLHGALRLFVERLEQEGVDWGQLTDDEVQAVADEAVDALVPRLAGEILLSSARHKFLAEMLRSRVQRAVWALTEHARKGRFRPVAVEASFGRGPGAWPGLTLKLDSGQQLHLAGQIDRIDEAVDEGGQRWVRIIDYKSSARQLPIGRIGFGLTLQLPLYMAVVQRVGAIGYGDTTTGPSGPDQGNGPAPAPAALLYFPIQDPLLRQRKPFPKEEWEDLVRKALRMQGLFTDDVAVLRLMDKDVGAGSDLIGVRIRKDDTVYADSNTASASRFAKLLRFAEQQAVRLAQDILAGRIDVAPYRIGNERACTYCPMRGVCQFDPLVEGNAYRRLTVPEREAAWEQIEKETAM